MGSLTTTPAAAEKLCACCQNPIPEARVRVMPQTHRCIGCSRDYGTDVPMTVIISQFGTVEDVITYNRMPFTSDGCED